MKEEVKGITKVLEILKTYKVDWTTVNKIENSLWDTGVAFFGKNYSRVAYYNEIHNILHIH
jgi:hypothetical protein